MNFFLKNKSKDDGYTLVELLVVIAIVGILSSVVFFTVSSAREKSRMSTAKMFEANHVGTLRNYLVAEWLFDDPTDRYLDSSGNEHDGTCSNCPTVVTGDGPNGKDVLSFDGINDYLISEENLEISGDPQFTMCAWINWSGATWSADYPSFMGNNQTGATNRGLSFTVKEGRPAIDFWNNRYRSNNVLSVNKWYFICGVKKPGLISTTSKIYVDGSEVPGKVEGTNGTPSIIESKAVIGRLDSNRFFKGKIDNARFYSSYLTASNIQKLYTEESAQRKLAEAK